jgi:hypothetical protein
MRRRDPAAPLTRTSRALICAAVTLSVVVTLGVQSAQAGPFALGPAQRATKHTYPTQNDVARARQHSANIGSQVSRLQKDLARSEAVSAAADVALSSAAEDFDVAQVELQNSQQTAKSAAEVAGRAGLRLDAAQKQVGQLAAQQYRSGGSIAALDVLLSQDGPDAVLERASMMHVLARRPGRRHLPE